MKVLVTGGAGYIGSHTVVELIRSGYAVTVVDNLSNASIESVARVQYLTKTHFPFHQVDLRDAAALDAVFAAERIDAVLHFAGLKAVAESVADPVAYWDNNVAGTLGLLRAMQKHGVRRLIFSSSATVYGDVTRFETARIPIPEDCPTQPINPYGETKLAVENALRNLSSSDAAWQIGILRYFNPIGAHPSGLIGEDPSGTPQNLLPYLAQVAIGRRECLSVYGSDYDSVDGTPIRDYIHVVDLAQGHIAALKHIGSGCREWNLGTGEGRTVMQVIRAFETATGVHIPHKTTHRRPGDVLNLTADCSRANDELAWRARFSVEQACRDLWHWTRRNPNGYKVQHCQSFDGLLQLEYGSVSVCIDRNGDFNRVQVGGRSVEPVRFGLKLFGPVVSGTDSRITLEYRTEKGTLTYSFEFGGHAVRFQIVSDVCVYERVFEVEPLAKAGRVTAHTVEVAEEVD